MAMNIGTTNGGLYTGSDFYQKKVYGKESAASEAKSAEKISGKDTGVGAAGKTKLSQKAQALLEKLQKTYKNMDFMAADYKNSTEAGDILSRGTKEFSVLFSTEELEKMASDKKYEKEYMAKVEGAVQMSNQINKQFGFESGFGKNAEGSQLTKIGMSFNSDGTTTLFASLEKQSDKKDHKGAAGAKKTTVEASSQEELIRKLRNLDWNKVKEEKKSEGNRFDFTV